MAFQILQLGNLKRWIRFVMAVCALGLFSVVQAQQIRFEGVPDPGYNWSRTWVDINNDGKDDHCFLWNSGQTLDCYPSNGTTFGPRQSYPLPGTSDNYWLPSSIRWGDFNGDGQIDVCRTSGQIGLNGTEPNPGWLVCKLGPTFTQSVTLGPIPLVGSNNTCSGAPVDCIGQNGMYGGLSHWKDIFIADVNSDGRADVCYLHAVILPMSSTTGGYELRCLLNNGAGLDSQDPTWAAASFDPGREDYPRGFYDFNGDGYPDFCRIADGAAVRCRLGGPNGFAAADLVSQAVSAPASGAVLIDFNGDGKTDFCFVTGSQAACMLSNGKSWETTLRLSPPLNVGSSWRWWVDINGDGLPDYCRQQTNTSTLLCRLSRGDGDGTNSSAFAYSDIVVNNVNFGGDADGIGLSFCDASGLGIQTLCRATYRDTSAPVCSYSGEEMVCYNAPAGVWGIAAGLRDESTASTVAPPVQANLPMMSAYSDGTGAETRINYMPMSRTEVYTRSAIEASQFPRSLIVQGRSPLVYETRSWRAGSTSPLTGIARYFYKDMRNDLWSGSRGFRERWILTEASNTLDHVVYFQGLGPTIDTSSILDSAQEIGQVKYQERFAVNNSALPAGGAGPRNTIMRAIIGTANTWSAIPAGGTSTPYVLLQRSTNTLADTTPVNPRYRYIGASLVESWDWNNAAGSVVSLPTVSTTTALSDRGNVKTLTQVTNAPNGLVWKKTTTNEYTDDESSWLLGRLTRATVKSESPSAAEQLAANPTKFGSAGADATSSSAPAAPQPISPAVMSIILQLLLDD